MPGQRLALSGKFVLVLLSGGPEHRPAVESIPYGPIAGAAEIAGRSAIAAAAHGNLQRCRGDRRGILGCLGRAE
eukprot:8224224-Alexandrium_andersonii.AAC.1